MIRVEVIRLLRGCGMEEREIIGTCDGCNKDILDGDDYRDGEEGMIFCAACVEKDQERNEKITQVIGKYTDRLIAAIGDFEEFARVAAECGAEAKAQGLVD
jgi:hypothetical protein